MVGEGLPRKVGTTKQSEWLLPDISDRAKQHKKRALLKHGLHAAFAFPLYAEGKLQAVLEFFSTTTQPPDQRLLHIAQSIGEQLGRVLERQRGEEQQRQAVAISDALDLTILRSKAFEATLNALSSSVYLTDRHSRIIYMNDAAKREVGTSTAISVANSRLAPTDRKAHLAIARAISEAAGDKADRLTRGFTIALPGIDDAGLIATVLPLAHNYQSVGGAFPGVAAIFVQDPIVMPRLPGEAFAKLYGLTRSELRVLIAMAPGLSVKEASNVLGVSESTAKTHLQHIYGKTGTSKQTELLHLFMSSAPPVKAA